MDIKKTLEKIENDYKNKRQIFNELNAQIKKLEVELIGMESNIELLKKLKDDKTN